MKKLTLLSINIIIIFSLVLAGSGIHQNQSLARDENCLSYIISAKNSEIAASVVSRTKAVVSSSLSLIDSVTACVTPSQLARIQQNPLIVSVFPNASTEMVGDDDWNEEGGLGNESPSTDYPDAIGADLVWEQGVTGDGITVAVLDTGISRHKGLMRGIDDDQKTRIIGWKDFVDQKKSPTDPNGHGTHIAGIIANSQLGQDGEWNGVAPGVDLVGVRVLNKSGKGTYETVIKGIEWVISKKDKFNIKVMNLSLVGQVQSPYWADPLNQAIMKAWSEGIVVVVAVGNTGSDAMTIGVPGNNPYVITVGAFTDNFTPTDWSDDYVAPFSSAGPTLDGFAKPDLLAPGAHMVSTMLPSSVIAKKHLANRISNQYFSMAGTSQSAAVVSGVSAFVLSNNPGLSPDEVKYRLMYTSFPWTDPSNGNAIYSVWQQGSVRVNAPDAVYASLSGTSNNGMDIIADLDGSSHYEGYSYWDEESQAFRLYGDEDNASGGFGLWSGGFGLWSGGFGLWSGGFGLWSGGYGNWAGGASAWDGDEPWAGSGYAKDTYVEKYSTGTATDGKTSSTSILKWVDEP